MIKFEVKKVTGPLEGGAAVFLGNEKKIFVIFVGLFEATAIVKEINRQTTIRPLTHDLFCNTLLGFDIQVKKVIISKIVDSTFCATLILNQKTYNSEGEEENKEVRIDLRASDAIVIALKTRQPIWVTEEVYEKVEDVSKELNFSGEIDDSPWKQSKIDEVDFDFPNPDEDLDI